MGVSRFGFGSVDTAPIPGGVVYRDAVDGVVKDARKIDSRTKQYVYDQFGRVQGMRGLYQLVQLAVQTVRNSSAVPNFGNGVSAIQVLGTNIQQRITDAINVALKDLVTQKLILINAITIDRFSTSGEFITVRWTDLTTGQEQVTKL